VGLDELPGGVADNHRAGFGLTLHPRRHIGSRPGEVCGVRGATQAASDDGARVDPHPDGERDAVAAGELGADVRRPLHQPQTGQHRAARVVLVHGGIPEARHHAVALELEHATVQFLHRLGRRPSVQGQDVLDDFGLRRSAMSVDCTMSAKSRLTKAR
jgi:hypothetical protein